MPNKVFNYKYLLIAKYLGKYKDNNYNGYGMLNFNDGTKYEGEWKDTYLNGYGIFTFNDGRKY